MFQLKLQFDDSLTVTFEYPSESSLLDDAGLAEGEGDGEVVEVTEGEEQAHSAGTYHALPNNAVLGEMWGLFFSQVLL